MRKIRTLAILFVVVASLSTVATPTTASMKLDGGDPPPICIPGDPGCKP